VAVAFLRAVAPRGVIALSSIKASMDEASAAPIENGPPQRTRLRWGPERRLRKRPEFKLVYEKGRRIRGRGLTLFRLAQPSESESPAPWRLGITVTRQAGGAVVRNRLRRTIREFFRIHQWELAEGWDMVVNAAPGLADTPGVEIHSELRKVLERAGAQRQGPA